MMSHEVDASILISGIKPRRLPLPGNYPNRLLLSIRKVLPVVLGWISVQRTSRSSPKRLRVTESVSLGEKRFVAVVHVDGLQFLVGGSATSVALLAQLNPIEKFSNSLERAADSAVPVLKRKRKPALKRATEQVGGNA
jgi:flagellar biogenesis protein FliO